MLNGDNKRLLIELLFTEWQTSRYTAHLYGRKVFFDRDEHCTVFRCLDGITITADTVPELFSQEEADTRIILHCMYAARLEPVKSKLFVRSPDTNVFILLISYSKQMKQSLIFIQEITVPREKCNYAIKAYSESFYEVRVSCTF